MKIFLSKRFLMFFVLACLIPTIAFPYKKVKCFVLKPPEKVLPGVKRIAILDFETQGVSASKEEQADTFEKLALQVLSKMVKEQPDQTKESVDYGRFFSNYLISKLLEKDRGIAEIKTGFLGMGSGREGKTLQEGTFTNVYEVIERAQIVDVLKEQALAQTGAVEENEAVQIGQLLGVQALVVGNVSFYHQDESYTETRTEKKKDKKITRKVNCERRKVNVAVRVRIVSAESGQIMGSTESKFESTKSHCDDAFGSLPTVGEMIDAGLQKLSTDVANYLTPHYELEEYELEKYEGEQYKKTAEKAAVFAEELKVDEAYHLYKSIYDKQPYDPEILYNLGVINEVVGNFQPANEYYNQAFQLKADGRYKKAIERTEKNITFAEALAQMGIEIKAHQFEVSAEEISQAVARKVEIKGSRDTRVNVYSQPDVNSDIVVKVPGSLTFTVLKIEGDWYLIQLLGEKQGYVHKDYVNLK